MFQGDLTSSVVTIGGLGIYAASLLLSLIPMVTMMRKIAARRGEPSLWISGRQILKLVVAMPITQFVHVTAIASAVFAKSTSWRGIRYYIDGPWRIRMEEYSPYRAPLTLPGDESLG